MPAGALRFNVRVSGAKEIGRALSDLPTFIHDEAREAMRKAGEKIVRMAKDFAPKDTMTLASGIKGMFDPHNKNKYVIVADLGGIPNRHIAAPVEYGRKKFGRKDAQPFMRPAIIRGAPIVKEAVLNAIHKAVYEAGFHPARFNFGLASYTRKF